MASEIIKGLFGFSPQELLKQREQEEFSKATQLAQLTPLQQISYLGFKGGNQFGKNLETLGNALFGIQDPEMQENSLLEQSAKELYSQGVDPMSSQGLSVLIQRMNAAGARPQTLERLSGALQQARMGEAKLQAEQALTVQRMREGRAVDPVQKLLESGKYTPESIKAYQTSGDISALQFKDPTEQAKLTEFARALTEQGLEPGTPEFQAQMARYNNARIEGTKSQGKVSVTNVLPGQKDPKDIPEFERAFNATVAPQKQTIEATNTALALLKGDLRDNPVAFAGARRALAKAYGDAQINAKDVQDAGGDPSLVGRILDTTSTLFTGTPTESTLRNVENTIIAIRKVATKTLTAKIEKQKKLADRAGYSKEDQDLIFGDVISVIGKQQSGKKQTRKTASGIEYTIEE